MGAPAQLEALGPTGPYRAHARTTVTDVAGAPLAELSLVPPVFVTRGIRALARAEPLPAPRSAAALAAAAEAFGSGVVAGVPAAAHQHAVSRVSGLPISAVRRASRYLVEALTGAHERITLARPRGAVDDWRHPATHGGSAVWTRRGEVFAVLAAGNHPAVHGPWPEALALGYRVAVRPSRREPFTPHRLVTALRAAGFGPDRVLLLPTDHLAADRIVEAADLSMVYGGAEVVDKYAADPTVLPQGPGRSKILLPASEPWSDRLDTIVASVADEGGVACTNATAVFVEGDPGPVAEAIAERLASLPSLPPEDDKAVLPVQPLAAARRIEKQLLHRARGCRVLLGAGGIADPLGDGSAALRPAVVQLDRADAPQAATELGFPCVWVAPWSPADGVAPLRHTLALTVGAADDELVGRLLREPTIANVYVGDNPTHSLLPQLPHDGFLGDFLMRTKSVIRPARNASRVPARGG
jgi:acyl-CoA reductase-like NAD-dependent aldehyde dehydrogenase